MSYGQGAALVDIHPGGCWDSRVMTVQESGDDVAQRASSDDVDAGM